MFPPIQIVTNPLIITIREGCQSLYVEVAEVIVAVLMQLKLQVYPLECPFLRSPSWQPLALE
jgi:hypothetical protein